jgi:predicted DNA-binding WGR domain protein
MEQYVFKPEIMRAAGWKILRVYSKDWFEDPDKVMKRVMATLNNEPVEIYQATEETKTFAEPEKPVAIPSVENKPAISEEKKVELTRLVLQEDGSNKFWEAFVEGNDLLIRYGRMNTKGQKLVKNFGSPLEAEREKEKLVRQKLGKGYQAVNFTDTRE